MYRVPAAAREAAAKVLRWKREHDVDAMTPVGWRRAHQLATQQYISRDTVARMAAFSRHRKNSQIAPEYTNTPWKDRGYVAWLGWGGDAGIDWALDIIAREKLKQED